MAVFMVLLCPQLHEFLTINCWNCTQHANITIAMTKDTCISESEPSCVKLPKELNHLNAIWPRYPFSDDDCQCPIFVGGSSGPQFSDCYCFALNLTSYTVILDKDKLCWMNLTRESNDTKILLARDKNFRGVFRRDILSQSRITVQGGLCAR